MYVGNLGFPESLLNYWYLYVIFVPILGGLRRSASVKPLPTSNSIPLPFLHFNAPTIPVHLPVPGLYPITVASSSWKVFTFNKEFDLLF